VRAREQFLFGVEHGGMIGGAGQTDTSIANTRRSGSAHG
jgi:hypothetical protein